jgi:photosystem II stability/assembly factor-like uncharacterized protein
MLRRFGPLLAVCLAAAAPAAPGFTWGSQASGTGQSLNAIAAASSTTAWAAGDAGTILKTADGGLAWAPQTSGTAAPLRAVASWNHSLAWAVGDPEGAGQPGTILATTNGGTLWEKRTSGKFQALAAAGPASAWAVGAGGVVRRTSNSGTDWIHDSSGTTALWGVHFVDANLGWAVGDTGTILTSTNSGDTWTPQVSGILATLRAVSMSSALRGWAVGDGGNLRRTIDGGATAWTIQASGVGQQLNAVHAVSDTVGVAVGQSGAVTMTSNGSTWSPPLGTITGSPNLFGVHFFSASSGVVVGAAGAFTTTDGGTIWNPATGGTGDLRAVSFSGTTGYAVGANGRILKSTTSGSSWVTQTSGTTEELTAVRFLSPTQGWAAGANGLILTTSDGGATWTHQAYSPLEGLRAATFVSAVQGWAAGAGGRLLATSNGGVNWVPQPSGVSTDLHALAFVSPTAGWAVGAGGVIRATVNGGTAWNAQTSDVSQALNGVSFSSPLVGWAVGNAGAATKTTDGGADWVPQTIMAGGMPVTANLRSITFLNGSVGFITGDGGLVLVTTTAGSTWTAQTLAGVTETLNAAAVPCSSLGWAVGAGGRIVKGFDDPPAIPLPQAVGTPYDWANPVVDGFVAPELTSARRPDTGWNRSMRVTQSGGTSVPLMAFQGLRAKAPVAGSLLLSFEVRGDASFDDNDYLVLLFRRNDVDTPRPDHKADDRRIEIFPVKSTSVSPPHPGGVDSPASTSHADESYSIRENGRPRLTRLWRWDTTSPDPDVQNWTQIGADIPSGSAPPTGFDIKVRSVDLGSEKLWSVEVLVPTTIAGSIPEWIDIADNFLFAFYAVRISSGLATEFSWPHGRVLSGAVPVSLQRMPACDWGRANKAPGATAEGVGFVQPQWDAVQVSQDGGATFANTVSTNMDNQFRARLVNTGTTDATNVRALFRIANWGVQMGDPTSGSWKKVVATGGENPMPPWNPVGPFTILMGDTKDAIMNWTIPAGEVPDYAPPHHHQCIMVELDSTDAVNFTQRSEWMNMQVAATSVFDQIARVDARGLAVSPRPGGKQRFHLVTSTERYDFDPRRLDLRGLLRPPAADELRPAAAAPAGRQGPHPFYAAGEIMKRRLLARYPQAARDDRPAGYLTWTVQGYRETDDHVNVNGTRYPIVEHVGGFGYVARHDAAVKDWLTDILGGVGSSPLPGAVVVDVPIEGVASVRTRIESLEGLLARFGAWAAAGVAIPHGDFADFLDPGLSVSIGGGVPLAGWLSAELIAGADFFGGAAGGADVDVYRLSAGLRAELDLGAWALYARAGGGHYAADPGPDDWGLHGGLGARVRLSSTLDLDASWTLHDVPRDVGDDSLYSSVQAGLNLRF